MSQDSLIAQENTTKNGTNFGDIAPTLNKNLPGANYQGKFGAATPDALMGNLGSSVKSGYGGILNINTSSTGGFAGTADNGKKFNIPSGIQHYVNVNGVDEKNKRLHITDPTNWGTDAKGKAGGYWITAQQAAALTQTRGYIFASPAGGKGPGGMGPGDTTPYPGTTGDSPYAPSATGTPFGTGTPGAGGIFAGPYGNNGPLQATPPSIAGVPLPGVGMAPAPVMPSPAGAAPSAAPGAAAAPVGPAPIAAVPNTGMQTQQSQAGSGSGGFSVGGGLIGAAEQGAALAANIMAPGAGQAISTGTQLANRAVGYAGQVAGIAVEGLLDTFMMHDAQGSGKGGWINKIAGGLAGAHASAPNSAGAAEPLKPEETATADEATDTAPTVNADDPINQQGDAVGGKGPGDGQPLVKIDTYNANNGDQSGGADLARQLMAVGG